VIHATGLQRALKALGVETTPVLYPVATHIPRRRDHQIDVMTRMLDWYDRHLGATPPVGSTSSEGSGASK
jgi:dipeptidyl aminopeptidase/acylaminoacyl peptidase